MERGYWSETCRASQIWCFVLAHMDIGGAIPRCEEMNNKQNQGRNTLVDHK